MLYNTKQNELSNLVATPHPLPIVFLLHHRFGNATAYDTNIGIEYKRQSLNHCGALLPISERPLMELAPTLLVLKSTIFPSLASTPAQPVKVVQARAVPWCFQ